MAMPIAAPRYTIRDLDSFPDDGCRYELLDGELLVTPAPAPLHQIVIARIVRALTGYLAPEIATVFSPGSVEVEPNVHLEPDILVVPAGALGAGIGLDTRWTAIRDWWLAVEVSGEGSTAYDRDYKGPAYLTLGVREVWRVDLRARCVYWSRPGIHELAGGDRIFWHPPQQAAPLVLSVPDLF
jgi:Uma2 family endonuclease